jgi:hypothetical protein
MSTFVANTIHLILDLKSLMFKFISSLEFLLNPVIIYRTDDLNRPYLKRWHIIPNNKIFNIYIHRFYEPDYDNAHDHPWYNLSVLLTGSYIENIPKDYDAWIRNESREEIQIIRKPFWPIFRRPTDIHRIELFKDANGVSIPMHTLFITGPHVREWGFWCANFFRSNKEYLKVGSRGESFTGKGCD